MFYVKKKYLYIIIVILLLCLTGFISVPFFNKKDCSTYENRTLYFKTPLVNIPVSFKSCSE